MNPNPQSRATLLADPWSLLSLLAGGLDQSLTAAVAAIHRKGEGNAVLVRPPLAPLSYIVRKMRRDLGQVSAQFTVTSDDLWSDERRAPFHGICSDLGIPCMTPPRDQIFSGKSIERRLEALARSADLLLVSMDGMHGTENDFGEWMDVGSALLAPDGIFILTFPAGVPANVHVASVSPAIREFATGDGRVSFEPTNLHIGSSTLAELARKRKLAINRLATVNQPPADWTGTVEALRPLGVEREDVERLLESPLPETTVITFGRTA